MAGVGEVVLFVLFLLSRVGGLANVDWNQQRLAVAIAGT